MTVVMRGHSLSRRSGIELGLLGGFLILGADLSDVLDRMSAGVGLMLLMAPWLGA